VPALFWIVPASIAVLIAVAGVVGYRMIRDSFRTALESQLKTLLDAKKEALRLWIEAQCRTAEMLAAQPAVRENAGKLITLGSSATAEALRIAAPGDALEEALRSESSAAISEGFMLLDPAGRVLAATEPALVGTRLPPPQTAMLGGVLDGKSRVIPPFLVSTLPDGGAGAPAMMLAATPVARTAGPAPGVLALRIPIAKDFTQILSVARFGKTGETYAFDREGRLLSESRFEEDLRAAGLLLPGAKSTLNIEIRDPGGNTVEGFTPSLPPNARPLTRMAASATAGHKGFDIEGYRDYRGVPVVGAWDWLPDVELGITHEVDVAEAYRQLRMLNVAFWLLFGVAALSALLLALGSVTIDRLRRRVRDAKQLGQYTLVEKIGEGAMGTVYRASHAMLRRPTAVKLLETREPGALERFEREVQLTSTLTHPNTIAIYDYGRTPDGIFYYAMEYIEGIDLSDLIRLEGPLSPARVVHLLRQVCGSLAEAHSMGLVHRDVKPSNIMLTVRGGEPDFVKVLDFGLVKRVERGVDKTLTTLGVVFGTPGFIPPETLRDPRVFDARGDIYALGAVAYELLCGVEMFDRTTAYEMCRLHVEVTPPEPSVRRGSPLPRDLENLVMRTLSKDPAARPQSATDFMAALEACKDVGLWTHAEARDWWAAREKAITAQRQARRTPVAQPEPTLAREAGIS
jgi:hypothetical protein